ncbi:MAG: DNA polymerase IV [Rhizobiales bacterium]|nr:DNA polymerase IV [Hyphomicrobiales bacterium]
MQGGAAPAFCRDCLAPAAEGARRCAACGSPRLARHAELHDLHIAHVDCDAFYASVEKRDDPGLADKPLIVGGGKRGVVSTCCYIARTFGVRSAMPMFKALALCPNAVVMKPDMAKYVAVARRIRAAMERLTPLVEPLSIDEAFLDLAGTERLHHASPAVSLARFAGEIEREIGVTVSVGLSYCKFLAKMASDLDKPRGFAVIGRAEAREALAPLSIGRIWGVGAVARERYEADGLRTIGDVQRRGEIDMMRRWGEEGRRLWRLANGIDTRAVDPERDAKSVSSETTYDVDVADLGSLERTLYELADKVSLRLKRGDLAGRSVTLKLKTAAFQTRTRTRSGLPATQLAGRIFAVARDLLRHEATGPKFRLIGVGVADLCPASEADRGDLVDSGVAREKATERAIDALREKFGKGVIQKGLTFPPRR